MTSTVSNGHQNAATGFLEERVDALQKGTDRWTGLASA